MERLEEGQSSELWNYSGNEMMTGTDSDTKIPVWEHFSEENPHFLEEWKEIERKNDYIFPGSTSLPL